jgi:hypothetical protein
MLRCICVRSPDTTPEAHAIQLAIYRRMSTDERLTLAWEMSEAARRTTIDGIRARHPDYDEATAMRAMFRLVHGAELYAKVWPHLPAPAP